MNNVKTVLSNLEILFEDNHLIAVNKRSGDLVQGDKTGDVALPEIIKSYLKEKYSKPGDAYLGVIHRLDRPTTGIVIFAKTSKALSRMNELFKSRETSKIYWAIIKNSIEPENGKLEHFIKRNSANNTSKAHIKEVPDSKLAKLSYQTICKMDNYSAVEIVLETGRHHQIRAQFSAVGSPVKGDLKYGFDRSNPDGSISLHARSLSFVHPVNKDAVKIIAKVPNEKLWQVVENHIEKNS